MTEARVFGIETAKPVIGPQPPSLIIYLVDCSGPLALPKELYRSSFTGQSIELTPGHVIPGYDAWLPAGYTEVEGYEALEAEIMKLLNPPSPQMEAKAKQLAGMMVSHVRDLVEPAPGQYV